MFTKVDDTRQPVTPNKEVVMLSNAPVVPVLAVKDLAQAIEFYEGKLGLKQTGKPGTDGVIFEAGMGTTLVVYQRDAGGKTDNTVAGFIVDDIESEVKELRARGVVFEQYDLPRTKTDELGIADMGRMRAAFVKDPEGNILMVGTRPT